MSQQSPSQGSLNAAAKIMGMCDDAETNLPSVLEALRLAEERAGIWMKLYFLGRLPTEVIKDFQQALGENQ